MISELATTSLPVRSRFIVGRRFPEMHELLRRMFAKDLDVVVLFDRRYHERRRRVLSVAAERRFQDRRSGTTPDTDLTQRQYFVARPAERRPRFPVCELI